MTHQGVFCTYKNLISLRQLQDAVILHTIYSFSINPYSIFLLTFEGIKDNLLIENWNHKSGQTETVNVSKELLNDLNYNKIYSNAKGLKVKILKDNHLCCSENIPPYPVVRGIFFE